MQFNFCFLIWNYRWIYGQTIQATLFHLTFSQWMEFNKTFIVMSAYKCISIVCIFAFFPSYLYLYLFTFRLNLKQFKVMPCQQHWYNVLLLVSIPYIYNVTQCKSSNARKSKTNGIKVMATSRELQTVEMNANCMKKSSIHLIFIQMQVLASWTRCGIFFFIVNQIKHSGEWRTLSCFCFTRIACWIQFCVIL